MPACAAGIHVSQCGLEERRRNGEDTLSNRYPGRNGGRDSSTPFPGPPERGAAMNRSASDRIQRE